MLYGSQQNKDGRDLPDVGKASKVSDVALFQEGINATETKENITTKRITNSPGVGLVNCSWHLSSPAVLN